MATYNLAAGDIGAYEKTLVAATLDTVQFAENVENVQIFTDGTAAIYVTVDGSDAVVVGPRSLLVPATPSVRTIKVNRREAPTTVKLISVGTPKYSVAELVA